jgi:hypothetical protein
MPERVLSTAPLAAGLALHALHRPREHLEARQRDAVAARDAQAERVVGHLPQRALDVLDGLARGGRQREVALTLDVDRVALARLLVELGVALLALAGGRSASAVRSSAWRRCRSRSVSSRSRSRWSVLGASGAAASSWAAASVRAGLGRRRALTTLTGAAFLTGLAATFFATGAFLAGLATLTAVRGLAGVVGFFEGFAPGLATLTGRLGFFTTFLTGLTGFLAAVFGAGFAAFLTTFFAATGFAPRFVAALDATFFAVGIASFPSSGASEGAGV